MAGPLIDVAGPLYINDDSEKTEGYNTTGIPTPLRNPYTWSKRVNLFAVDSPAPVGFSFCSEDGPSGDGNSCGAWNDTAVFAANRNVLVNLFTDIFPELKKNELFIVGESYAGVYVPGIVNDILSAPGGLNLKGYAVGDGCMASPPVNHEKVCKGPFYDIEFFGGHGQFSNELRDDIRRDCPRASQSHIKISRSLFEYGVKNRDLSRVLPQHRYWRCWGKIRFESKK